MGFLGVANYDKLWQEYILVVKYAVGAADADWMFSFRI